MLRSVRSASGFVAAVLLAGVLACSSSGGGGGGGENPPTSDTTPPAIDSVVAVDALHLDVVFDETLDPATASHVSNYTLVEAKPGAAAGALVAPGDTVGLSGAALDADGHTVHLTCDSSMAAVPYDLTVWRVADDDGNAIDPPVKVRFTGTTAADVTPPTIVDRTPAPGATNVGVGQAVTVTFSEPMDYASLVGAFSLSGPGGPVTVSPEQTGETRYTFTPVQAMAYAATYTVRIDTTARDRAGNALAGAASWTFTTTAQPDTTPPSLVSTVPADGAANVATDVVFALTFDEAVDPNRLGNIVLNPDPGPGIVWVENAGRTVRFDPDATLLDNTLYTLVVPPGAVYDLAGNGNTQVWSLKFTTGATLPTGSVSGTLTGDPVRPGGSDPSGATVVLSSTSLFGSSDLQIVSTATADAGGAWTATNVPDGTYYVYAFEESNGDGIIDPSTGDVVGAYGIDWTTDWIEDSIQVAGSNVTGIDFRLFDPMAISGQVFYDGSAYAGGQYPIHVGVFDTTGFRMDSIPAPAWGWDGYYPWDVQYSVEELVVGLPAGTYYVGAYMDVDPMTPDYDPAVDPGGFYGGPMTPQPVTIANGSDGVHIDIHLLDPAPPGARDRRGGVTGARRVARWGRALRASDRGRRIRVARPPR